MYGCRPLCTLFYAFADRDFLPMFLCIIEPGLRKKEIDKSGVAMIHHKVNIPILAEAASGGSQGNVTNELCSFD